MQARLLRILPLVLLGLMVVLLAGCGGGGNLIDRVSNFWSLGCCGTVIVILDIVALIELAGSPRGTGSKLLWAALIVFFPVLGCLLYYFFGR